MSQVVTSLEILEYYTRTHLGGIYELNGFCNKYQGKKIKS